jgi:hypothetical protein
VWKSAYGSILIIGRPVEAWGNLGYFIRSFHFSPGSWPVLKTHTKLLATDDSNVYWATYGGVLQKRTYRFNVPNADGLEPLNDDLSSAMGTKYSVQQIRCVIRN